MKSSLASQHTALHHKTLQFLTNTIQRKEPLDIVHTRLCLISSIIQTHLKFEESFLMPIYKKHQPENSLTGKAQNFIKDHRLLKTALTQLLNLSAEAVLKQWSSDILLTPLLNLYDLFEHHDKREESYFYPVVLKHLSEEQTQLCQKEWTQEAQQLANLSQENSLDKQIQHVHTVATQYRKHMKHLQSNEVISWDAKSLFDSKRTKLSQNIITLPLGSLERLLKEKQLTRLWINTLNPLEQTTKRKGI